MTYKELHYVLAEKNIFHFRVNGFKIEFNDFYTIIAGRIPLSLARKFNNDPTNPMRIRVHGTIKSILPDYYAINAELQKILDDFYYQNKELPVESRNCIARSIRKEYIKKLESEDRLDELYVLRYHIDSAEGVKHVIDCILESGYTNQCLYDILN